MITAAHPILSCADAIAWEKKILGGDETREWSAMSRAGRAIARSVIDETQETGGIPDHAHLLALCGKGNNGGDALIALHALLDARPHASALVLVVPDFAALRPLVRRALEEFQRAHAARLELTCVSGSRDGRDATRIGTRLVAESFDVCLDGLFGMQFRPPFRAPADWLIELINEHPRIRVRAAVDVPSGIGDSSDAHPFRADFSYATGIAKAPLFAAENAPHIGRARYLDLGFFSADQVSESSGRGNEADSSAALQRAPSTAALKTRARGVKRRAASEEGEPLVASAAPSFVLTARVLDSLRALRDAHADKRAFGHLFVVSGSRAMPGAVFMSVKSALLSGAGLVTAFVPETLAAVFAAQLPEAMWVPMPETPSGGLALEGRGLIVARATRCSALLAGPGLGRDAESLTLVVELLRALDVPTVLDADALQRDVLSARARTATAPLVLTPHAGEFKRIVGDAKLDEAARELRATIVLKGAPTRLCSSGAELQPARSDAPEHEHERKHRATVEPVYVCPFGGPVLARGGSGDILAGMLGAQLAQGAPALEAAARAVVWHGRAADCLARAQGQASARVTQLCDYFFAALAEDDFS